jgi:hypothetical protein
MAMVLQMIKGDFGRQFAARDGNSEKIRAGIHAAAKR